MAGTVMDSPQWRSFSQQPSISMHPDLMDCSNAVNR
jgi:hypothetical protein